MDEDGLKAVLREAFGDSSDSDCELGGSSDGFEKSQPIFVESYTWEPITEISGLWICRDFLSPDQQSSLLSSIEKEGCFADASHNQVEYIDDVWRRLTRHRTGPRADNVIVNNSTISCREAMRFGDLPSWAVELSYNVRESVLSSGYVSELTYEEETIDKGKEACLFPPKLLQREPLFNQLIVNVYQPGEGIGAHVDLMRFEDGIAVISLESSCVMHFSRVENEVDCFEETGKEPKIPVLLIPGSLVLMWGEARYMWKHEINRKPGFQNWQGLEIDQKRRTSVTLRKLGQM
ncbi:alkylated DNA repair protein alkB homolog 8 isoform X1 [Olea europaea var. sylvestris]|uniref:alkylated DNA repair protein alkB homolog 8 isoform X1 n=1 Tax=Olea europaea var. sylvestris TaxID=158386 RepID=UPI000C1CD8F6|nr:alkylated DNA repair protein alkB homolog 8 isoform X1 [Olea europaea var. sylvestris]